MSEKEPKQLDEETLFRYQIVSTVLSKELLGWSRTQSVHLCDRSSEVLRGQKP